ncbi:MAG: DinB family protein [Chitinophagaceae bacterium]|nr:MAG: DinB family protein [Chitinophagaceae bacterium]
MSNQIVRNYILQIQRAFQGDNWLDENFDKKLELINEQNAFQKPADDLHSIAEIVSHIIEWRKELLERLEAGRPPKLKMESPNNWIPNSLLKTSGWSSLLLELRVTQTLIITFLEKKDDAFLSQEWLGGESYGFLVAGWLEHDLYHLGQIGLIYKMVTRAA